MKELSYPEWVYKYKTKGTVIKKVGNKFYLYKATSKRIPGKKYPQPIEKYIGVLDEDKGLIKSNIKEIDISNVEVYEYGFSYVLYKLVYDKLNLSQFSKNDRFLAFVKVIKSISPNTYLLNKINESDLDLLRINISLCLKNIEKILKLSLSDLGILKYIYLIKSNSNTFISTINNNQLELLKSLGVDING